MERMERVRSERARVDARMRRGQGTVGRASTVACYYGYTMGAPVVVALVRDRVHRLVGDRRRPLRRCRLRVVVGPVVGVRGHRRGKTSQPTTRVPSVVYGAPAPVLFAKTTSLVVYRKAPGGTMLVCTMAVLSWQCAPRHGAPQMVASTAPMEPLAAPLRWREEPDNLWTFTGWSEAPSLTVNYIVDGPEDGQPFLLIHGFGASGFHWRRNVPALAAAGYRVYAIDLVGFGCPALHCSRAADCTAPARHPQHIQNSPLPRSHSSACPHCACATSAQAECQADHRL